MYISHNPIHMSWYIKQVKKIKSKPLSLLEVAVLLIFTIVYLESVFNCTKINYKW